VTSAPDMASTASASRSECGRSFCDNSMAQPEDGLHHTGLQVEAVGSQWERETQRKSQVEVSRG